MEISAFDANHDSEGWRLSDQRLKLRRYVNDDYAAGLKLRRPNRQGRQAHLLPATPHIKKYSSYPRIAANLLDYSDRP